MKKRTLVLALIKLLQSHVIEVFTLGKEHLWEVVEEENKARGRTIFF